MSSSKLPVIDNPPSDLLDRIVDVVAGWPRHPQAAGIAPDRVLAFGATLRLVWP
ncbi:MAG: hypothetical protein WEA76_04815 [Acidimicrobiia bacterium]